MQENYETFDVVTEDRSYGICPECKQLRTGYKWCQLCYSAHFRDEFSSWTSGNKNIDEFIQERQLNSLGRSHCIEWVSPKKFKNIQYLARGGFGTIHKAEWTGGPIVEWDPKLKRWKRELDKRNKYMVALKSLDNSQNITADFLDEVRASLKCSLNSLIIRCLGITRHLETGNYMMIMDYGYGGNMRKYVGEHFKLFNWWKILTLIKDIVEGLKVIHEAECVHRDFHSGNIVYNGSWPCITDLGLCQPADKILSTDKREIYGVLPYIAPEVIRGEPYKSESDIYSLGIVMWELSCAELPFKGRAHDMNLAIDICNGDRPAFKEHIPPCFRELISRCWNDEPSNRPNASEILATLNEWWNALNNGGSLPNIIEQFLLADQIKQEMEVEVQNDFEKSMTNHPQAVYTSRILRLEVTPMNNEPRTREIPTVRSDTLDSRQLDLELTPDMC